MSVEPEAPEFEGEVDVSKSFRFNSQWVFLTYAQANTLDRGQILEALQGLGYFQIFGGEESHQDGGRHFHIICRHSKKKIDVRNGRYWDIAGHHPNVRHVRNFDKVWSYCAKDGNTFSAGTIDPLIQKGSFSGFRNRKADLEEFKRHVADKGRRSPFPLLLWEHKHAGGITLVEPTAADRQRCLYVTGTPNSGKSRYFTALLDGTSSFYAADGELEFDSYGQELLIVYDDRLPSLPSLISTLNYSKECRPCPGRQRYFQRSFKGGQVRFVIIIINNPKPWVPSCTNSSSCFCPGCTRCIYYNWDLHYEDPSLVNVSRIDFTQ
nr:MAG TPA: Rep protein [Genomoviridae sp.]